MNPVQWTLLFALWIIQTCTASPVRYSDQVVLSFDEKSFLRGIEQISKPRMHYNMTASCFIQVVRFLLRPDPSSVTLT